MAAVFVFWHLGLSPFTLMLAKVGVRCLALQILLTLNTQTGGPLRTPEGDFCDPALSISTNLFLIFVCVPHQLKINIM